MNVSTLVRFLFGQRQAIVEVVSCRSSLWLGALFVLSAGFAREYNQEDLLHDSWYLIIPLAASLATSLVLYCLFYLAAKRSEEAIEFLPFYRRFLSLYWMTAPLAWLYAIPVESHLSAADAVRANLSLLALISLWRVLLISRCASVLFGAPYLAAFFLVMFFADTLVLGILYFTPLPIFNIMGGISHTESEWVIINTAMIVGFFGGISWLIWLIAVGAITSSNNDWTPLPRELGHNTRVSKPLWAVAIASLLVWIAVLPISQPPQQLRRLAETNLQNDRVNEAIKLMSSHDRDDFPPHWDPPPWPGYGQNQPRFDEVLKLLEDARPAGWVVDVYRDKVKLEIKNTYNESRKKQLLALLGEMDIEAEKPDH